MPISQIENNALASTGLSATKLTTGTLPKAQLPTGSTLQFRTDLTTTRLSTSSSTFQDFLATNFTPVSASSTLILMAQIACNVPREPAGCAGRFFDATNNSNIGQEQALYRFDLQSYSNEMFTYCQPTMLYVLSSWGTTQRTIKAQVRATEGTVVYNETFPGAAQSSMLLIYEVAA